MDDLSAAISGFLEQPGAMEQLESMAKQLGLGPQSQQETAEPVSDSTDLLGISPEKLAPLMEAFGKSGQPTAETALLEALRPFLGTRSQEKVERAKRALGLMRAAKTVAGTIEL